MQEQETTSFTATAAEPPPVKSIRNPTEPYTVDTLPPYLHFRVRSNRVQPLYLTRLKVGERVNRGDFMYNEKTNKMLQIKFFTWFATVKRNEIFYRVDNISI